MSSCGNAAANCCGCICCLTGAVIGKPGNLGNAAVSGEPADRTVARRLECRALAARVHILAGLVSDAVAVARVRAHGRHCRLEGWRPPRPCGESASQATSQPSRMSPTQCPEAGRDRERMTGEPENTTPECSWLTEA